ncbi:hypothetical protein [Krasilnikovia sp. MM14-A1259]|uniref:hypothetical protein n=1 Tax=Krasilnikovia sp. MM14-A1259 TaxID=3373539 RepID=UPI003814EB2E
MFARPVLVGLVAVSVLLSAGCGSGKSKNTPTNPPPAPSSAAPNRGPSTAAEQDALTAYRGMWSAFVEAAKTSDPEAPDVRKYASEQALKLISSSLYSDRSNRQVTQGELHIDPKVTALKPVGTPTEATIVDCVNDENWLKYQASGGLVNDVPGGKHHTTATVKRTHDGWKVSSFILREKGTC